VPAVLKDGDVVTLGETTLLKVTLAAAPAEHGGVCAAPATVESFLTQQCEQHCARLQSDMDAQMALLRQEADVAVAALEASLE